MILSSFFSIEMKRRNMAFHPRPFKAKYVKNA